MPPTNILPLAVHADGQVAPLAFSVRRVVNAGYAGRDRAAVQTHIDELRRAGIPPPSCVPALYPVSADNVTTDQRIEVVGRDTSGEVEYVLLLADDGRIYVTVGSDHTDRALERADVARSKQICKNVISRDVWRYEDVRHHWDELVLQSWVRPSATEDEVHYQHSALTVLLPAEELLELVRSRLQDDDCRGLVIYSGTIPIVAGRLIAGDCFRGELFDPRSDRRLGFAYQVAPLAYLRQ